MTFAFEVIAELSCQNFPPSLFKWHGFKSGDEVIFYLFLSSDNFTFHFLKMLSRLPAVVVGLASIIFLENSSDMWPNK